MKSVKEIQEFLVTHAGANLVIDNDWGPLTHAAYERYLRQTGGTVPPWMAVASRELGVMEKLGPAANERIIEYHEETTLAAESDEISWCSSFINWTFAQIGIVGTKSAAARSWLKWGRKLNSPRYGAVVVFWRGAIDSWQGHVAYVIEADSDNVLCLGGNQSNRVCVASYDRARVLGFQWPTLNQLQAANLSTV